MIEFFLQGSYPTFMQFTFITITLISLALIWVKSLDVEILYLSWAIGLLFIFISMDTVNYIDKFTDCKKMETVIEATNSAGDNHYSKTNIVWCGSREHLSLPFTTYQMRLGN